MFGFDFRLLASTFTIYCNQLEEYQFGEFDMTNDSGQYTHHYKTRITQDKQATGKKLNRLVQECGTLSTALPLHPDSSVFMIVDSERIDVMQVLITGPEGTRT